MTESDWSRSATNSTEQIQPQRTFRHGDVEFKAGDSVLVHAGHQRVPFIGRILHVGESGIGIRIVWLYRPQECPQGRQPYHGVKEVFQSNHLDVIPKESISDKCRVLTLAEYTALECVEENDYFCRYRYSPTAGVYSVDPVPIFCVCKMPYNPDRIMVYCDGCHDWYHPECLALCRGQVESAKCKKIPFLCPYCLAAGRQPSKPPQVRAPYPAFDLSKPCFNPAFR